MPLSFGSSVIGGGMTPVLANSARPFCAHGTFTTSHWLRAHVFPAADERANRVAKKTRPRPRRCGRPLGGLLPTGTASFSLARRKITACSAADHGPISNLARYGRRRFRPSNTIGYGLFAMPVSYATM